jgi:hypothetical protein
MSDRWVALLLSMTVAACVGCSSSDVTRYDVSGTVTIGGQPVPSGAITFQPAAGNTGPGGYATVKDGKFDTAVDGKGTTGGPHYATISGYDGIADPGNEKPFGSPLFNEYRTEVDLPKEPSTQNFDVPVTAKPKPQVVDPNRQV